MEQFKVDYLVIGAGVVGLAIARCLALNGREVLVLEKESGIGTQTSSRNSEVIHAGIYYPQNSLKAKLCVDGKSMLYDYCEKHSIPVRRCGKLIVATSEDQRSGLELIKRRAELNGVYDLQCLSKSELLELESEVDACSALLSPSTGVFDSHAYMLQLQADIEGNGGHCVFNSELSFVRRVSGGVELKLLGDEALITAKCCINASGLNALPLVQDFARADALTLSKDYARAFFAKGSYFSYGAKVPFNHLIYPVPEPGGLGIHLTLDMQGRAKFGPDVEWLTVTHPRDIDYTVDVQKRSKFLEAVRKYWPQIDPDKMQADYSGVRPKLSAPGEAAADFLIQGPMDHGIDGLINLAGIESPGLTSSLSIAEYVVDMIKAHKI